MGEPTFTELNDLACSRIGSRIIFATDDFFAPCENMIKQEAPVWKDGVFTDFGKWMDGWETRRKRTTGHDWCIVQLGYSGRIHGFDIDTRYFTGNYPPQVSVQAACLDKEFPARSPERLGSAADDHELQLIESLHSHQWETLLPTSCLQPGYEQTSHNYFGVTSNKRWTHLRVNLFPDGGVARFHAYGSVVLDWLKISEDALVDMAAMTNGGMVVAYSSAHYGRASNLIVPYTALNMGDGWETARRLDRPPIIQRHSDGTLNVPGCEWVIIQLGHAAVITEIEVDTNHFKGNFPDSCFIEGLSHTVASQQDITKCQWQMLLPIQKLTPNFCHQFKKEQLKDTGIITHIRFTIAPDGGVSRLRAWGHKKVQFES